MVYLSWVGRVCPEQNWLGIKIIIVNCDQKPESKLHTRDHKNATFIQVLRR